ncbi:hypothetical protein L6452_00618 [Arctium lappa]|uniref:Uncharacterized protein n=1 Tax=Arctium lappa TaxID=4217 RepID=A0ACB9FFU7_ARCLA|nr:hypothetical protein L6452_00618 [Arctium lappa]
MATHLENSLSLSLCTFANIFCEICVVRNLSQQTVKNIQNQRQPHNTHPHTKKKRYYKTTRNSRKRFDLY